MNREAEALWDAGTVSAPRTVPELLQQMLDGSRSSQAQLARRAGIPRSVLNVYLRGRREPGAKALLQIVNAAGFELAPARRQPPVDEQRASGILVQVLELAEALPFRPRAEMECPPLAQRLAERAAPA